MRRPLRGNLTVPTSLALAVVLLLGVTGTATARSLITGAQIKNGTISSIDVRDRSLTSRDVKDGSLRLADIRPADRAALQGEDGASGFGTPPSGTTIVGGGSVSGTPPATTNIRLYVPLGFRTAAPLTVGADPSLIKLGYAPGAAAPEASFVNAACTGTPNAPTAPPGALCVYISQEFNVATASADLDPGVQTNTGADSSGFEVVVSSSLAGTTVMRFSWAYTAP